MSIFSFPLPCVGEISILSNKRLSPMRKEQLLPFLRKGREGIHTSFRVPEWTNPEALRLSVNGEEQKVTVKEGYVSLNRTWSKVIK